MRIRCRWFLAVFIACGAVTPEAEAQSACVAGSAGAGTATPEATCTGSNLNQQINYSFEAPTEVQHCCQNNCWNGSVTYSGEHLGYAYGQCQYAGAGQPPICHPDFTAPYYWGYSSPYAIFKNSIRDVVATTSGCVPQPWDIEDSTISVDGCCAPRCQDSASCSQIGEYSNSGDCVCSVSPVILDLDGGGLRLTDARGGVNFDLACSGVKGRVAWTAPDTSDGFLALDRNGNGLVDDGCELFGSATPQPPIARRNGFNALGPLDTFKDSAITAADPAYAWLRVWVDANHNGISEPGELRGLLEAGIQRISLAYKASGMKDQHGNMFRYRADVDLRHGVSRRSETSYDVFLVGPGEDCDLADAATARVDGLTP